MCGHGVLIRSTGASAEHVPVVFLLCVDFASAAFIGIGITAVTGGVSASSGICSLAERSFGCMWRRGRTGWSTGMYHLVILPENIDADI